MSYILEICANSVQSAINAQIGGADRVELCDNLWEAGTTPSAASIKLARANLTIGLNVLIRPRGGDFCFSDLEMKIMLEDIAMAKDMGVDGIVCGVLNADRTIDLDRTRLLVEQASPLPFTYHRAFDVSKDLHQSMEELKSLEVDRLLTSGGADDALAGLDMITQLREISENKVIIMPGGGINESNIDQVKESGCTEYHMTASATQSSPAASLPRIKLNGSEDIPEDDYKVSDVERVRRIRASLSD